MSEVKKTTVLYEREQDGVAVKAIQEVREVLVKEAQPAVEAVEGDKEKGIAPVKAKEAKPAVYKDKKFYSITATVNGEVVTEEEGTAYRTTIARARKLFKEVYEEYGPKPEAKQEEAVAE